MSVLVVVGWWITGSDGGLCPPCARKSVGRYANGVRRRGEMEIDRHVAAQSEVARARRRRQSN